MGIGLLHLDMDAFFASVEVRDDPSLAGKPVIVGGEGNRGVVAACTYEARAYGIHSAMPSVRARRLCPQAIFVHGNYDRYATVSRDLHAILRSFTPLVEGISIDEAFLDVRGAERLFGNGPDIAWAIRRRVTEELGLSCSVGVAAVKFLTKLASEAAKPKAGRPGEGPRPGAGVCVIEAGGELAFLHPLPVQALWGVGPATLPRLQNLGVRTIGDLALIPLATLVATLGQAQGQHLHELSWARDPRRVTPDLAVKSVSHSETYANDLYALDELRCEVVRLADGVGARLVDGGLAGRTVSLSVRYPDFRTISRSHTEPIPTDSGHEIARIACALLDAVDIDPGVRLLGVSVTNLGPPPSRQLTFEELLAGAPSGAPGTRAEVDAAVDAVRARFGHGSVGPAVLASGRELRVKRRGEQQWGPGQVEASVDGERHRPEGDTRGGQDR